MAIQYIDIGSSANDGTGDPIRTAGDKINDNFIEVYAGIGAGVITETTTARTAAIGDAGAYIRFTNGSATNFTIPANATVPFVIGTVIQGIQAGAGALSLVAAGTVTINSRGADLTLAGQYGVFSIKKVATNEWDLTGDL